MNLQEFVGHPSAFEEKSIFIRVMQINVSNNVPDALIGAVIGSVGATFMSNWLSRRGDKQRQYENVVQKYLLQLQDAVDSLWFRLYNLRNMGGRNVMEDSYFEVSTLYSLGKVLAYKYMLVVEGVYYNLEKMKPGLGHFLREKLEAIDHNMNRINYDNDLQRKFFRYDRQTLAESVMQKGNESWQASTLLEFKQRYDDSNSKIKLMLAPAREFVFSLERTQLNEIMQYLAEIAKRLETETGIKTAIKES